MRVSDISSVHHHHQAFSLYTQQWYMSYRFADSLQAGSGCSILSAVSKTVWHIPLLCVQWKSPNDGQRNCLKHVEFYSKNKFEKLLHLVGFIIGNLSRCTVVTWTSNCLVGVSLIYKPGQHVAQVSTLFWRYTTVTPILGLALKCQPYRLCTVQWKLYWTSYVHKCLK